MRMVLQTPQGPPAPGPGPIDVCSALDCRPPSSNNTSRGQKPTHTRRQHTRRTTTANGLRDRGREQRCTHLHPRQERHHHRHGRCRSSAGRAPGVLVAAGLRVTMFEKASKVGGVWSANYADFGLQVPKELCKLTQMSQTAHSSTPIQQPRALTSTAVRGGR
eukprot:7128279-Prymnesium_polylepis.1